MTHIPRFILFAAIALGTLVTIAACKGGGGRGSDKVLARAYGENLYAADVKAMLGSNLTPADSAKITDTYIGNWLREHLAQHLAQTQTLSPDEERLVASYRSKLLLDAFTRTTTRRLADSTFTEAETRAVYDSLRLLFTLDRPSVQLDYARLTVDAKVLETFRPLWANTAPEGNAALVAFCKQNADTYSLGSTRLEPLDRFAAWLPAATLTEANAAKGKTYEGDRDGTTTFIRINEVYKAGQPAPYEAALPQVRAVLMRRREQAAWAKYLEENYQAALKSGSLGKN